MTYSERYNKGYKQGVEDCPHYPVNSFEKGTPEHKGWIDGYRHAQKHLESRKR